MQADIPYTVATGEKLVNETFGPNNIHRKTSGTQEWHAMEVRDGRQGRFSLDENGFVVRRAQDRGARFPQREPAAGRITPRSPR